MARVKRERDRFVGFVLDGVDAIPASDQLRGSARFVDDRTLEVGTHTRVTFDRAVIATGSSPAIPPLLRAAGDRLIVNDDVFAWDDLPRSVAVFGPGVIGLELGQALHRLGVRVVLFGRHGHVGPFTDPAIRAYARRTFERELDLESNADVREHRARRRARARALSRRRRQRSRRRPSTTCSPPPAARRTSRGLGLENTSLALDARGVPRVRPQHDAMRRARRSSSPAMPATTCRCCTRRPTRAASRARTPRAFPTCGHSPRRTPLAVVFSDPQLAVAGARYADLAPGTFVTGEVSFEDQGRSRVMLRNTGLLHVYADIATGRLLGAEMIGPDAEHLGHLLAWAIQAEFTVARALAMPFYHPVVEEGLRTALRDADAKRKAARLARAA